jgi:hypothetical protein
MKHLDFLFCCRNLAAAAPLGWLCEPETLGELAGGPTSRVELDC